MGTTRRRTIGLTGVAVLLAAALGAQMALAQSDGDDGPPDEELIERLDALEPDLPDVLPSGVDIVSDETWGTIEGDFGGAATTLDTLEEDLRSLYRDADDREGVIAEAISDVARGWLDLAEAYDALEAWQTHDLAFPLDTSDDDEVATGADEARGHAERGLRHVLRGQRRLLIGYVTLREEGPAPEPDTQARFDGRAGAMEDFDETIRPLVHRLLSLSTTMVMLPAERFSPDAPGVEAHARSYTVTCVDRGAYLAVQEAGRTGEMPTAEDLPEAAVAEDRVDCPDLPEGVESAPTGPAEDGGADDADEPAGDATDGTDGDGADGTDGDADGADGDA